MALWQFMDYWLAEGICPIQQWYDAQVTVVRARFDAALLTLAGIQVWDDPEVEEFKVLSRFHKGLGEVRFSIIDGRTKRRFRPLGIWPPVIPNEFILLAGCEKSGRIVIPHGAFEVALGYKSDFENRKGFLTRHPLL